MSRRMNPQNSLGQASKLAQAAMVQLINQGATGHWVVVQDKTKVGFTTHVKTGLVQISGTAGPLKVLQ